jgi:zinc transporter, ZIP family
MILLAGACIPLGGLIAKVIRIRSAWLQAEFRHFVIALGGGVLLGAVAIVLIPEGKAALQSDLIALAFILFGGGAFFVLERYLGIKRRSAPQLFGMMLDFIPEAIALGGLALVNPSGAILLAVLIGLQNLPEGFNTFYELKAATSLSNNRIISYMMVLSLFGPIAALIGFHFLAQHQEILGAIMLFSSGGILYLIFQDIAPQAKLKKHWAPPLGAVIGYCIALAGQSFIH